MCVYVNNCTQKRSVKAKGKEIKPDHISSFLPVADCSGSNGVETQRNTPYKGKVEGKAATAIESERPQERACVCVCVGRQVGEKDRNNTSHTGKTGTTGKKTELTPAERSTGSKESKNVCDDGGRCQNSNNNNNKKPPLLRKRKRNGKKTRPKPRRRAKENVAGRMVAARGRSKPRRRSSAAR